MVEIGIGLYNEFGYKKFLLVFLVEGLVKEMFRYCLDEIDFVRGYVKFNFGDEMVLLVSNFGGMLNLEMGGFVDEFF